MSALTLGLAATGLVFGFLAFHFPGMLWGGVTGGLIGLVLDLQRRLSVLEKSHQALALKLAALNPLLEGQSGQTPSPQTAQVYPEAASQPAEALQAVSPDPWSQMEPRSATDHEEAPEILAFTFDDQEETAAAVPPPLPQPGEFPLEHPPLFDRIRHFFTATNVVVGVGLIVLFFGVAFLLKLAIDRGLISIEMRYLGVCLLGLALLATGWLFRKRRRDFALLVQGGAMGILYIAVFSAARWHELMARSPAFFIMVGLVILSGVLAVMQNARGLAVLAAVGGFLAPILTSSGRPEHVLLFSYCALLGAGIFGVAFFKSWRELNLIGFGFTLVIGCLWGWRYYRLPLFSLAEFFLTLFFLLYLAITVLSAIRQPPRLKGWVDAPLIFGLPMAVFGFQAGLVDHLPFSARSYALADHALAWSALFLGLFYFLLAAGLWRISFRYLARLVDSFLAIGVLFISLAVPLAFNNRWIAVSWALEGAALVWIGLRQNRKAARAFGLLLIAFSGPAAFPGTYTIRTGPPIFNGWYIAYLTVAVSAFLAGFFLFHYRHRRRPGKGILEAFFLIYGLVWWYGGGLLEIDEFVPGTAYQNNAVIAFLAVSGVIWSVLYRRLAWTKLKYVIFCLAPLLILFVLGQFPDLLVSTHPFQNLGYLAWPLAFLIQYLNLHSHESDLGPIGRTIQHLAALVLPVFILTRELVWGLDHLSHGHGDWAFLGWGLGPGLAAALLTLSAGRLPWPVQNNRQTYLSIGLPLLLASNLAWLIYGSVALPGKAWPFTYLVVFNPLESAQVLITALLWIWFAFLKQGRLPCPAGLNPDPIPYVLGAVLFLVINAVVARAIHHWELVPWRLSDLWTNMVFQTAISIFWSVLSLSLMVVANRKGWRGPWFAGGSLLAVVVLKLFLVDLSQTGTITRIVSFLAVGLLMLLIGYLSPLPPKAKDVPNGP